MRQHILVILDGSRLAEAALPHAAALARATSSALTLLQVILPVEVVSAGAWGISAPALARRRRKRLCAARGYLEGVAGVLQSEGLVVHCRAMEGAPAGTVLQQARLDAGIFAIAIATHYGKGISHPLFGSVSVVEELLRSAPVPLLLVTPDQESVRALSSSTTPHPPYRTIVVPLDGSKLAERALRYSQLLACTSTEALNNSDAPHNPDGAIERAGAKLVLLSVAPISPVVAGAPRMSDDAIWPQTLETEQHERGAVEEWEEWEPFEESKAVNLYLQEAAQQLRYQGHVVQTSLAHGDPVGQIVRSSEEAQADLIVMTSHGRRGAHRLWVGSVATEVVRRATVPVLLVNAGAHADGEEYKARQLDANCVQNEPAPRSVLAHLHVS